MKTIIDSSDDTESLLRDIYEKLAIGRWVPVTERLPEFRANYWSGYMIEDGRIEYDIRSEATFKSGDITHWLELDIPEVKQ